MHYHKARMCSRAVSYALIALDGIYNQTHNAQPTVPVLLGQHIWRRSAAVPNRDVHDVLNTIMKLSRPRLSYALIALSYAHAMHKCHATIHWKANGSAEGHSKSTLCSSLLVAVVTRHGTTTALVQRGISCQASFVRSDSARRYLPSRAHHLGIC